MRLRMPMEVWGVGIAGVGQRMRVVGLGLWDDWQSVILNMTQQKALLAFGLNRMSIGILIIAITHYLELELLRFLVF